MSSTDIQRPFLWSRAPDTHSQYLRLVRITPGAPWLPALMCTSSTDMRLPVRTVWGLLFTPTTGRAAHASPKSWPQRFRTKRDGHTKCGYDLGCCGGTFWLCLFVIYFFEYFFVFIGSIIPSKEALIQTASSGMMILLLKLLKNSSCFESH